MTEQELKQSLRERGLRVTPQRVLIHRALTDLGRHATAEEVLERVEVQLPNASLPTVYASLELFEDLGIARRVAVGSGATLWDPRSQPHHHLVCTSCRRVEDLDVEIAMGGALRAARRQGFRPNESELILKGLCERCQTRLHGPDAHKSR